MAAVLLPPSALNCGIGSDVSRRRCMCEVGGSTSMSLGTSEAFLSAASSSPRPSVCSQRALLIPSHKGNGGLSLLWFRRKGGPNLGFEFGERRFVDRRGQRRLKGSPAAAQDQTRDVFLQTDPAEESRERLVSSTSGDLHEEGIERGELEVENGEESPSEHLKTDSLSSSSATSEKGATNPAAPEDGKGDGGFGNTAAIGTVAAGLGLVGLIAGFGTAGYLYRDQLNDLLIQFLEIVEGYGPAGYGVFVLVYAVLEMLAIPAIPLTMSAGLLFGAVIGTVLVSIAGTIAATGAFLIARYLARDRLMALAKGNKKFLALDKAIGDDGFRVVTLLRLSPLLPFSLGNYLYGLTSVKLGPYVLGTWLGTLPGSWAYGSAGAISRTFIVKQSEADQALSGGPEQWWTLGLSIAVTVFAATYVTRLAKEALKDIDD